MIHVSWRKRSALRGIEVDFVPGLEPKHILHDMRSTSGCAVRWTCLTLLAPPDSRPVAASAAPAACPAGACWNRVFGNIVVPTYQLSTPTFEYVHTNRPDCNAPCSERFKGSRLSNIIHFLLFFFCFPPFLLSIACGYFTFPWVLSTNYSWDPRALLALVVVWTIPTHKQSPNSIA